MGTVRVMTANKIAVRKTAVDRITVHRSRHKSAGQAIG